MRSSLARFPLLVLTFGLALAPAACKSSGATCEEVGAHLGGTDRAAVDHFTTWCKLSLTTPAQRDCAAQAADPAAALACAK